MVDIEKGPDRIYVSKEVEKLITTLDSKKYLDLDKSTTARKELFLFAMALGVETNTPTKLSAVASGGFVLEQNIRAKEKSLMHAFYINEKKDEPIDTAADKEKVYTLAQEYANTGFQIIEEYMKTKPEETIRWKMIEELDSQYEEICKEYSL